MRILERWRKPGVILDVQEADSLIEMPNGELRTDLLISVDDETLARIKLGYICANCLEPQEEPFPEVCHAMKLPDGTPVGCFYRIRDRQLADLESRHGSMEEVRIGPKVNKAEELERLRELDAYEERTGIRLPDSVKFPTTIIENR